MAEYPLEYTKSFLKAYKNDKKLAFIEFENGHEITGEVIAYLDDPLSDFLANIEQEGLIDDTVVVLFSDHGLHM